jgi:hypothetical protein
LSFLESRFHKRIESFLHASQPFSKTALTSYKESQTMAPINVGFIGYGFSTKCFHLPFIIPNPDLEVYAFLQRAAHPIPPQMLRKANIAPSITLKQSIIEPQMASLQIRR